MGIFILIHDKLAKFLTGIYKKEKKSKSEAILKVFGIWEQKKKNSLVYEKKLRKEWKKSND
jgi:hypothetical protein